MRKARFFFPQTLAGQSKSNSELILNCRWLTGEPRIEHAFTRRISRRCGKQSDKAKETRERWRQWPTGRPAILLFIFFSFHRLCAGSATDGRCSSVEKVISLQGGAEGVGCLGAIRCTRDSVKIR